MPALQDMINISAVNAEKLEKAGIHTPEQLIELGSKQAFLQVRLTSDPTACLSMLQALEGAIQNTRWFYLDDAVKKDLKDFYATL